MGRLLVDPGFYKDTLGPTPGRSRLVVMYARNHLPTNLISVRTYKRTQTQNRIRAAVVEKREFHYFSQFNTVGESIMVVLFSTKYYIRSILLESLQRTTMNKIHMIHN